MEKNSGEQAWEKDTIYTYYAPSYQGHPTVSFLSGRNVQKDICIN